MIATSFKGPESDLRLSPDMSDIELAVTRTKVLESLLEQTLGATGKGLHEKVTSVQDRLAPALVKKIRFIATIRNKIVHESSYQKIDDREGYARACDEAEMALRAMMQPGRQSGYSWRLLTLAALIVAAVIAVVWRLK